jgi:hypothetical protein
MDFIIFSSLKGRMVNHIRISYDIACQWSKKLPARMQDFPESIRSDPAIKFTFGIPKFHLTGHGPDCQAEYSFNYLPGSGRTCGESVETDWHVMNIVGASTREMSPAARQETLDDHWGYWNFRKISDLGGYS